MTFQDYIDPSLSISFSNKDATIDPTLTRSSDPSYIAPKEAELLNVIIGQLKFIAHQIPFSFIKFYELLYAKIQEIKDTDKEFELIEFNKEAQKHLLQLKDQPGINFNTSLVKKGLQYIEQHLAKLFTPARGISEYTAQQVLTQLSPIQPEISPLKFEDMFSKWLKMLEISQIKDLEINFETIDWNQDLNFTLYKVLLNAKYPQKLIFLHLLIRKVLLQPSSNIQQLELNILTDFGLALGNEGQLYNFLSGTSFEPHKNEEQINAISLMTEYLGLQRATPKVDLEVYFDSLEKSIPLEKRQVQLQTKFLLAYLKSLAGHIRGCHEQVQTSIEEVFSRQEMIHGLGEDFQELKSQIITLSQKLSHSSTLPEHQKLLSQIILSPSQLNIDRALFISSLKELNLFLKNSFLELRLKKNKLQFYWQSHLISHDQFHNKILTYLSQLKHQVSQDLSQLKQAIQTFNQQQKSALSQTQYLQKSENDLQNSRHEYNLSITALDEVKENVEIFTTTHKNTYENLSQLELGEIQEIIQEVEHISVGEEALNEATDHALFTAEESRLQTQNNLLETRQFLNDNNILKDQRIQHISISVDSLLKQFSSSSQAEPDKNAPVQNVKRTRKRINTGPLQIEPEINILDSF